MKNGRPHLPIDTTLVFPDETPAPIPYSTPKRPEGHFRRTEVLGTNVATNLLEILLVCLGLFI
jgi:hypothetical protein